MIYYATAVASDVHGCAAREIKEHDFSDSVSGDSSDTSRDCSIIVTVPAAVQVTVPATIPATSILLWTWHWRLAHAVTAAESKDVPLQPRLMLSISRQDTD